MMTAQQIARMAAENAGRLVDLHDVEEAGVSREKLAELLHQAYLDGFMTCAKHIRDNTRGSKTR